MNINLSKTVEKLWLKNESLYEKSLTESPFQEKIQSKYVLLEGKYSPKMTFKYIKELRSKEVVVCSAYADNYDHDMIAFGMKESDLIELLKRSITWYKKNMKKS